jgi:hypothetical protein
MDDFELLEDDVRDGLAAEPQIKRPEAEIKVS